MTQHGGVHEIGIARIDRQCRDLLSILQTQMAPGLAAIRRFVDSIPYGKVGTLQSFSTGHVNDLRTRRRDGDGANRSSVDLVEDRLPSAAKIIRLPDASVDGADIEDVRLLGNTCRRPRAAPAKWPDQAPAHLPVEVLTRLCPQCRDKRKPCDHEQNTFPSHHVCLRSATESS